MVGNGTGTAVIYRKGCNSILKYILLFGWWGAMEKLDIYPIKLITMYTSRNINNKTYIWLI